MVASRSLKWGGRRENREERREGVLKTVLGVVVSSKG